MAWNVSLLAPSQCTTLCEYCVAEENRRMNVLSKGLCYFIGLCLAVPNESSQHGWEGWIIGVLLLSWVSRNGDVGRRKSLRITGRLTSRGSVYWCKLLFRGIGWSVGWLYRKNCRTNSAVMWRLYRYLVAVACLCAFAFLENVWGSVEELWCWTKLYSDEPCS